MECRYENTASRGRRSGYRAFLHFPRRPVREGDGQNMPRRGTDVPIKSRYGRETRVFPEPAPPTPKAALVCRPLLLRGVEMIEQIHSIKWILLKILGHSSASCRKDGVSFDADEPARFRLNQRSWPRMKRPSTVSS